MRHRGAVSADGETGDGAGILTQIPWRVLIPELASASGSLRPDNFAVGLLFLPAEPEAEAGCRALVEEALAAHGLSALAWREVPTRDDVLGRLARETRPSLQHLVVGRPAGVPPIPFSATFRGAARDQSAGPRAGMALSVAQPSHAGLQGAGARRRALRLLPGSRAPRFRERLRRLPQPLQHQHPPSGR
jgi:hypothetical protein